MSLLKGSLASVIFPLEVVLNSPEDYLPMLVVSFSSLPLLSVVNASQCESILWCSSTDNKPMKSMSHSYISKFGDWFMQWFQNVECLKIVRCEELLYMWQNEILLEKPPHVLHNLALLRELCISNCPSLVSIPEACFISSLGELKISNCKALTSLPKRRKHNNAHLESLEIEGCDSLTFIVKGQLPLSLKYLSVRNCEKLQYLLDDREDASTSSSSVTHKENINPMSTSLLQNLNIYNCSSLTCLSTRGQLLDVKYLQICYCSNLKTLSSIGHLPATLENLVIWCCPKRFCNNRSIERICIKRCANLRSIPEGLHSLSNLREIYIEDCSSFVFFPEGGLPDAIIRVSISRCEKLKALPNCLHNVNFLQDLKVCQCPSLISFPDKSFPSSLTSLSIEDPNIYTSLIAWGLHKLTSLRELNVIGCPDAISFPQEEMGMLLPTSLIKLTIARFPKLEYLSSRGFQNLSSLEFLWIRDCPRLTSFPEVGLPCSLLQLYADGCTLLKKHCKKVKGKEWSKISDILALWYIINSFMTLRGKNEFYLISQRKSVESEITLSSLILYSSINLLVFTIK